MLSKDKKKKHSRIPRQRNRKSAHTRRDWGCFLRKILFWLLFVIYGGVCAWVFLLWDGTRIVNVQVSGTQSMNADNIAKQVQTSLEGEVWWRIPREQYIFVRRDDIARVVRSMSGRIRDVVVRKRFAKTVEIEVTEWDHVYVWCVQTEQKCFLLGDDGRLGRVVNGDSALLRDNVVTRIEDKSVRLPRNHYDTGITPQFIATVVERFAQQGIAIDDASVKVEHHRARELSMETREGWVLRIATDRSVSETVSVVASVLANAMTQEERERLISVDARLGRKVFYEVQASEEEVFTQGHSATSIDEKGVLPIE